MSDDLDPRLAGILRQGPPPPVGLDPARRAAILAEARQAWFCAQARRRQATWITAAAACLAAGIAGWAVRSLAEPTFAPAPIPVAAIAEPPAPSEPRVATNYERLSRPMPAQAPAREMKSRADTKLEALTAPAADAVVAHDAARPPAAPAAPAAMMAPPVAAAAPMADTAAASEAGPPPIAGRRQGEGQDGRMETAKPRALMKSAAAKSAAAPIQVPVDAPERGRLLAAAAVLHAVQTHALLPEDRIPALQAAQQQLTGIDHPAADELRRAIAAELQRR